MTTPPTRRRIERVHATVVAPDGTRRRRAEQLAGEEPLELRINAPGGLEVGRTATMRTPGDDFALAAGLLLAEGVIAEPADIARIRYCAEAGEQEYNVVTVDLARAPRHPLGERTLGATASCGVCGTASIDALLDRLAPVRTTAVFAPALLAGLPDQLRAEQALFDETGGLHAAGLFDGRSGRLLAAAEDIGRHNALDKAIGARLLAGAGARPATHRTASTVDQAATTTEDDAATVAVLSGRIGFELVQKAAAARIAVVCAVSAPSTLAVHTAERLGITLAGFVRDGRMTLYSHPERLAAAPAPTPQPAPSLQPAPTRQPVPRTTAASATGARR